MIDKWVLTGILSLSALAAGVTLTYIGFRIVAYVLLAVGIYFAIITVLIFPPETRHRNVKP